MKYTAIVQARLGSTRLPGKLMLELAGQPMLWHVIQRLKNVPSIEQIICALPAWGNQEPARLCLKLGVDVALGNEEDVLARFYQASTIAKHALLVRVTADNPLIDLEALENLCREFATACSATASNAEEKYGFVKDLPLGTGAEVFTKPALVKAYQEGLEAHHREHVTTYMKEHPELITHFSLPYPYPYNGFQDLRLTVDTETDLKFMKKIYEKFYKPAVAPQASEVIELKKILEYI